MSDRRQQLVDKLFDSQANYWKDTYNQKDIFGLIYQRRLATALEYIDSLSLPIGSKVLEIGSGAGLLTVALARRGFLVEAIDHSESMVNLTSDAAKWYGVEKQVNAAIGDAHCLSFGSNSFKLVVALGVLPWLYDCQKALREINRVMFSGGFAVLTVDNVSRATTLLDPITFPAVMSMRRRIRHSLQKIGLLSSFDPWANSPSYRQHSTKDFLANLYAAGFAVKKCSSVGFGPFTFFGRSLFPERVGSSLDVKLQSYADKRYPIFRSAGSQVIALV